MSSHDYRMRPIFSVFSCFPGRETVEDSGAALIDEEAFAVAQQTHPLPRLRVYVEHSKLVLPIMVSFAFAATLAIAPQYQRTATMT
jgi:hypothetical protein